MIKSRYLKVGLCVVVFFSLIGVSNLLLGPIYNQIGNSFRGTLDYATGRVKEDLGLRITYESLSPSIFGTINVNDITITDAQSQNNVALVHRLSLSYSLLALLKGDRLPALKSLSLRDVEFELVKGENDFWVSKITQYRENRKAKGVNIDSQNIEDEHRDVLQKFLENLDPETLDLSFLKNVRIYRLHALYKNKYALAEGNIAKAVFSGNSDDTIDAKFDGNFNAEIASQKITGDLDFSSALPKGFEGSSAVLRFSNISALGYRVRYIGFLADYKNKNFNFSMLPSAQNVFMQLNAALDTGDTAFKLVADNFNVSRMVQTSKKTQLSKSIFSTNFSLNANAQYNYKTKNLAYDSSGDVFIPAAAFPSKEYADDVLVSYEFSGDENKIDVKRFVTSGERYNLSFEGDFDFKSFQPEGSMYIDSIVFPNGSEFSSELYVEKADKGFMCFSPQMRFNQHSLTAAEFNVIPNDTSWDFTFDVSDYSHLESDEPGRLSLYGSYTPLSKEYQASASVNTVYLDSVIKLYSFFANANMQSLLERTANTASPFVFTGDGFVNGVGGDYAFNLPYVIVANTVRDDQMLVLAADGNNENIRVSNLDFIFGGQHLVMNADSQVLDKNSERDINGRLELNGIPYNFNGIFTEDYFSVTSEYGFSLQVNTDTSGDEALLTGLFSVSEFPFVVNTRTYSLSNETSFSYSASSGLNINIPLFEARVLGGSVLNPSLAFSGSLDSQGIYLNSVAYSDVVSTLIGNGNVLWTLQGDDFAGANFSFGVANPDGIERISLAGDVTNPLHKPVNTSALFSGDLLKNLFFTAGLEINSLRSKRFVSTSREGDSISASITMQGDISNPFITLSVPSAVFTVQNKPLIINAQGSLEDMILEASEVSVDFGSTQVKKLTANLDLKKWIGNMNFAFETEVFKKKYSTEVSARTESLSADTEGIPDSMNIFFDTGTVIENNITKLDPYHISILKMQNDLIISSSNNIGLSGIISNYKNVDLKINNPLPLKLAIEGTVARNELNILVSDVNADLPKITKTTGLKFAKIFKGTLTGGFAITGSPQNPFFSGALDIVPADFNFPKYFKKHATTDKITLIMSGSQFYTEPTRCSLHRTPVDVTVNVQMNRLAFENLDVHVKTVGEAFAPLNVNLSEIHIKGDAKCDLDITYDLENTSVTGEIVAKDTNAEFGATRLNEILSGFVPKHKHSNENEEDSGSTVDVSLNIKTQSRVQISYSSFLRAVVVPGSEMELTYFGDQSRLLLNGDVPIRSGEITYLNSSFYIKQGSIHFSDNDESFDPRVTVRAETKTHDENNDPVTVHLRVENQHLSELSPILSASPAKSEREIMEILGTIITANSDNVANFALATGDFALQTVFTRKLENALRDFCKFDIFSVRTMVVQNAVKQGIGRENISNTAGNYLDGTTVYIGKYLGNSIFADAMLRLDYDENRVGDKYTVNGLSFRPEIGFTLESPFANIRWSMSPDFEDLVNLRLVQNTALTLSWKFNF